MEGKSSKITAVVVAVLALVVVGTIYFSSQNKSQSGEASSDKQMVSPMTFNPPTAPLRFTVEANTSWKTFKGTIYSYSFSYPETLKFVTFPNDLGDSVAINWGNIPPEQNILLNIELIDQRDPKYVGKIEDYANNWWKFYPGLKGVKSVSKITNSQGMVGYKASYISGSDQTPNIDIFFEVPNNEKIAIRIANGILDPEIFNKVVDSLKWVEVKATSSTESTESE